MLINFVLKVMPAFSNFKPLKNRSRNSTFKSTVREKTQFVLKTTLQDRK